MSTSDPRETGRMKGLIGFWNSKSVSETPSFRPSAVSSIKSIKNQNNNTENQSIKSSSLNLKVMSLKSCTENEVIKKNVPSNYLSDRVTKIEDERREIESKFGERGNGLQETDLESSKQIVKKEDKVIDKEVNEGLKEVDESEKAAFTRKQPSSMKSTTKTAKTISPFAKFKEMESIKSIITEPGNRRPVEKTASFSKGSVRFPSPCSSPSSPSSESKIKRNLAARSESTAKEIVLNWVKERIKNYPIPMTNFSSCWNDGLAFCALVHSSHPQALDWKSLSPENRRHNFTLAFQKAEEFCDIYPLLEVEDMVRMTKPDWKCVFTYVQSFYRKFRSSQPKTVSSTSSPSSNVPSIVASPPPSSSSCDKSISEICQDPSIQ